MSTVVIAKSDKGWVLGCDSQVTRGYNKHDGKQLSVSKIFKANGVVVGGVGRVSDLSLLNVFLKTHKPKDVSSGAILDLMVEFMEWCKKKDSTYKMESDFIFAFKNNAFQVCGGLDVSCIKDFWAIGSGMFVALGVMEGKGSMKQALEAATKYDLFSSLPLKIIEV